MENLEKFNVVDLSNEEKLEITGGDIFYWIAYGISYTYHGLCDNMEAGQAAGLEYGPKF